MNLLYVEASPRGENSVSAAMGQAFVGLLEAEGLQLEVDRLQLWEETLPEFDGPALAAKYATLAKTELAPREESAWGTIRQFVARLDRADALLIATPMWNFGIPYRLKHWFDLVTQPGLSFSFDPKIGYTPLLRDRPAIAIVASAGDYSKGPSWGRPDLASGYLSAALGFIGLSNASILSVGPTAGDTRVRQRGIEAATGDLKNMARIIAGAQ